MGYEPERGGGPWEIAEGRAVNNGDEMVIDRVLAKRHGLKLGEESAEYQGQTYYFYAHGCRSEFLADPTRFVGSRLVDI